MTRSASPTVIGLLTTALVHSGAVVLLMTISQTAAGTAHSTKERTRTEVAFVDTKLVRLGREFSPREMPNKMRATRSTGQTKRAETPSTQRPRAARREEPEAPPDSVEDLMTRLGQSAAEQARIAEASEREGHAGGIEEGTETTGNERQLYQSQLYRFFRRGFQMPGAISEAERVGLTAFVSVRSSAAGLVEGFDVRSSGNADFDQAVRLRMGQAVGATLPTPPNDEIKTEFFGASFRVSFSPPR